MYISVRGSPSTPVVTVIARILAGRFVKNRPTVSHRVTLIKLTLAAVHRK